MKSKLLVGLFIFLFLVSIASAAITMPHPIFGQVTDDSFAVKGVTVDIENTNTGKSSTTVTDDKGRFLADLGNVDPTYRDGDKIIISLSYCKELDKCAKSVYVSGGGNQATFDIALESLPVPPSDTVIIKHYCWDGSGVSDASECPIQPVPPVIEPDEPESIYVCADGTEVAVKSDCPESSNSWIYWVIGVLVALFAGAGGWKFYGGKFKHYHRGIKSYHDPNTRHSNTKYRHTLWKENALKCIGDVKKIEQGIDLSQE